MAEMLGSAVVGETVSRISSFLAGKHEEKTAARDNLDRLELAHIKMKAALETSDGCLRRIIDDDECPSLLLWQAKLKRAAEESGDALEAYKRRATEDQDEDEDEEEAPQRAKGSSLARRIAHTAKSVFSSILGGTEQQRAGGPHPHAVVVRRYERYADSAGELVRFMEFGAAPRRQQYVLPEDPLVERLLEGKFVWYRMLQGSQYRSFRLWPMAFTERGLETLATFVYQDRAAPANDFTVGLHLSLRKRADIVWITAECMRSFRPQLKFLGEAAEKEFDLLGVRNLIHEPCVPSKDLKLCALHGALMQSWRPGPGTASCEHDELPCIGDAAGEPELLAPFPEQAVLVFAQCRISPSSGHKQQQPAPARSSGEDSASLVENQLPLELGFSFRPHASTGRLHAESTVPVEFVDGKQERRGCGLAGVSVNKWDELLPPKAISSLSTKPGLRTYEAFWNSAHGESYLRVEKTSSATHCTIL